MELNQYQRDILRLLAQGVRQSSALKSIGVSTSTWYRWKNNPDFKILVDTAITQGNEWEPPEDVETAESLDSELLKEFLKIYIQNGGLFEAAANAVGSRDDIIITYMTPGTLNYDKQFHRLMLSTRPLLERRVLDSILENINNRRGSYSADAKWLLERWVPDEFGKRETVVHEDKPKPISNEERDKLINAMLRGENITTVFLEVKDQKELVQ